MTGIENLAFNWLGVSRSTHDALSGSTADIIPDGLVFLRLVMLLKLSLIIHFYAMSDHLTCLNLEDKSRKRR